MTTHQDQPPLSRRALREERSRAEEIDDSADAGRAPSGRRARAAAPEGLVEVSNTEVPNDEVPNVPNSDATDAPVDEAVGTDAEAQDAPVLTDSAIPKAFPFADQVEATSDDAGHPGFRLRDFSPELSTARADAQSASDWTPAGDDESVPLDYQTQGGPAFGHSAPYTEPVAPQPAPAEEPSFDSLFSDLLAPEAVVDDEPAAETETPAAADIPVGEPVVVAEPVALVAPVEVAPEERTLSRREWRAMRAAAEAAASAQAGTDNPDNTEGADQPTESAAQPAADESPADVELLFQELEVPEASDRVDAPNAFIPPLVEPTAAPQSALSDAMAEFEALTRETPVVDEPATENPTVDAHVFTAPVFDAPALTPPAAHEPAPAEPEAAEKSAPPSAVDNAPFSFLLNPTATVEPATPANTSTSTDNESAAYTPPIGHWSRQAELDDENQPFENTLSRDVGGGNVATTTNALVLPMIPQRDDFSSVLNATGEIMVTGTINLPGSVGTTGRDSRHYDDPEVDHLFDAFDNEVSNTDSAPVRAITAVSSHTATRGGIEPGRKQNNRVLTILLVTAGVMAVSVLGLLVAGFVFRIF